LLLVLLEAVAMPPEWSASLDEDGSLQVSSEHIFELAAIVHGYSLDSVLISDTHPRPNEPAGCRQARCRV
jgi:hypothetical protein